MLQRFGCISFLFKPPGVYKMNSLANLAFYILRQARQGLPKQKHSMEDV